MKSRSSPPNNDVCGPRRNSAIPRSLPAAVGILSICVFHNTHKKQQLTSTFQSFTFEPHPTDYGIFKVVGAPEDVGGDTLWASGYEAYDRLSPVWKKLADGLTATHRNPGFHKQAKDGHFTLVQGPRGHPENVVNDIADAYEAIQ